jgi:hypothetical protein
MDGPTVDEETIAMPDPMTRDQARSQIQKIRRVRWVLVALSAVVALWLIAEGNLVIGALVGTMAIVRGWMLVTMNRRLDAMRAQRRVIS